MSGRDTVVDAATLPLGVKIADAAKNTINSFTDGVTSRLGDFVADKDYWARVDALESRLKEKLEEFQLFRKGSAVTGLALHGSDSDFEITRRVPNEAGEDSAMRRVRNILIEDTTGGFSDVKIQSGKINLVTGVYTGNGDQLKFDISYRSNISGKNDKMVVQLFSSFSKATVCCFIFVWLCEATKAYTGQLCGRRLQEDPGE
uniref:Polymerase nucleotidyl transferase domain-containing protein n=1 Tax=Chromera velia CCMP2878 TaxID=1169474 RepID=A0A0G4GKW1_9ALVE|eukprot:Cvel_22361.t1-p1 / transcript=Cvel_22361.t1 / gene=Cvel_22361 / organism=Chromera_velia_CCMP2878 / gene_product=hypothetical protein / transcript_product=hypothetical protein / location=Cvel_scaffold2190:14183-18467(-) / protein_length=201 / sequence_SO=supercontig / SO=protein_coding / is_pseudo=false